MDGMSIMLRSLGIDKDAILGDLETVKVQVNAYATNLDARVTNIEKMQDAIASSLLSLHAKMDAILSKNHATALLDYSPIIPAGDDGLFELEAEVFQTPVSQVKQTIAGQSLQLVNGSEKSEN